MNSIPYFAWYHARVFLRARLRAVKTSFVLKPLFMSKRGGLRAKAEGTLVPSDMMIPHTPLRVSKGIPGDLNQEVNSFWQASNDAPIKSFALGPIVPFASGNRASAKAKAEACLSAFLYNLSLKQLRAYQPGAALTNSDTASFTRVSAKNHPFCLFRQNLCIFRHLGRFLRVFELYSLNREIKTAGVNSRTTAGSVFLHHHDLFRVPKVLAPLYPEFILPKRLSWI
jgi:hypothetical protein